MALNLPPNVVIQDKVLRTTNGMYLPLVFASTTMYVRDCYVDLYDVVLRNWKHGYQGVFLSGSPGVGKSFFLNYLLIRLLGEGRKVLFVDMANGVAKIYENFDSNPREEDWVYYSNDWTAFHRIADEADAILVDPPQDSARSQILTLNHLRGKKFCVALPPDPENCKELIKKTNSQAWTYMGPAPHEEVLDMRSNCYSSVKLTTVESRFTAGGGIPRLLFQTEPAHGEEDNAMKQLKEKQHGAISDVVENPRRIDSGNVAAQFKHLWSLYHLVPTRDYGWYTIEVCGDSALTLLRRRLLDFSVRRLWDLYSQTDARMGTLRGLRFEAYAHKRIITHGLQGTAWKLGPSGLLSKNVPANSLGLNIPPNPHRFYLKDNNVTDKLAAAIQGAESEGGYIIPRLPNFPVLDSAYVPPFSVSASKVGFQMKAGKSKPLSAAKVKCIENTVGSHLVVIVPNEYVLKQRLPGPDSLKQYLLVLREDHNDHDLSEDDLMDMG